MQPEHAVLLYAATVVSRAFLGHVASSFTLLMHLECAAPLLLRAATEGRTIERRMLMACIISQRALSGDAPLLANEG